MSNCSLRPNFGEPWQPTQTSWWRHYFSPEPHPGSRHWTFLSGWNSEMFRPEIHPPSPLTRLWWSRIDLGPIDTHVASQVMWSSYQTAAACISTCMSDPPRCHGQVVDHGPTGWFFCLSLLQSAHFRSSSHTCRRHCPHDLWSADWSETLITQAYRWLTQLFIYFKPKLYYHID